MLFHIPNGGRRDQIEAKHLKDQGVKKGVPDICLPVARRGYNAMYIELKTERGRPTIEQKWWGERLQTVGNFWTVCHGWEDATQIISWYLGEHDEQI